MGKKHVELLSSELGLKANMDYEVVYGEKQGFSVAVTVADQGAYHLIFSVKKDDQAMTQEELKQLGEAVPEIASGKIGNFQLMLVVSKGMTASKKREYVKKALDGVVEFFMRNGYTKCCALTGKTDNINICLLPEGVVSILTKEEYDKISFETMAESQAVAKKSENIVLGTVGAILGSLIGVAAIVLISQLGYVAVISGVIMGIATITGYELLGKKLSIKGIIICVVVILFMVYFAYTVDLALELTKIYDVDIFTAFSAIQEIISSDELSFVDVYDGLGMLYLCSLGGCIPVIWSYYKNMKLNHTAIILN